MHSKPRPWFAENTYRRMDSLCAAAAAAAVWIVDLVQCWREVTVKFRSPSDRRTKQFANDQKVGRKKDSRQTHVTHLCNIILSHFEAKVPLRWYLRPYGTIVSP
jgi:hypothetical protein